MTRRFDIAPVVLAVGAIALLVSLFLDWYAHLDAWRVFEFNDVLLAALAVATLVSAAGLITAAEYLDRRALPWLVGAAFVLVTTQLINPPPGAGGMTRGLGLWMAFVATIVMGVGTLLSFSRISFAVNVEPPRDRRQRVAAVDHRPPPTETGAPVSRSSESLLHPRPESSEEAPEA